MPSLDRILEKLASAQERLLRAADAVPAEAWNTSPREGAWSAAEVIAHVITIERTVTVVAGKILKKQPKETPWLKRFRLPLVLAEIRLMRLKTPIPVDSQCLGEKKAMFAEVKKARGYTLALIEENRNRDLRVYRWRHPFLGSLNTYQWFALLGAHQIRHEKQIREIAAQLPSTISSSQK
jgi:hypothetical protein